LWQENVDFIQWGTTNLIDHLVATHGFQRTPLKPPREECSDSGSSSKESYKEPTEIKKERKYRDQKEQTEVFIRSDKDYDYWGPLNIQPLPEPYVTYAGIRDVHNNSFFRSYSKVEMKSSEKWVILCLATLNSELSPVQLKRERESDDTIAFIMNMDTKAIKKEMLSKLTIIKGAISAEMKREANLAMDSLPDWILKNDSNLKRSSDGVLLKKDPFDVAQESSSGEREKNVEDGRFPSPERKKQKNGSGSSSNIASPISSPMSSFSTPVPPVVSPSAGLSNFSRMKQIVDEKYNKPSLLSKRREFTIAPPEPPVPLENPRDD